MPAPSARLSQSARIVVATADRSADVVNPPLPSPFLIVCNEAIVDGQVFGNNKDAVGLPVTSRMSAVIRIFDP